MEESPVIPNEPAQGIFSMPPPPLLPNNINSHEKSRRPKAAMSIAVLVMLFSSIIFLTAILLNFLIVIGTIIGFDPLSPTDIFMFVWLALEGMISVSKIVFAARVLALRNWARKALSFICTVEIFTFTAMPIAFNFLPPEHKNQNNHDIPLIGVIILTTLLSIFLLTFLLDIVLPIVFTRKKVRAAFTS